MEEFEENKVDNSSIELEDVIDSVDYYFTPKTQSDLNKIIVVTPDMVKKAIVASTSEFVIYEDETLEQCTKRYIEMALLKITKDEFLKEEKGIDSEDFIAAFEEGDIDGYMALTLEAAAKKLEAELGELKGNANATLELKKLEMKLNDVKDELEASMEERPEEEQELSEEENKELEAETEVQERNETEEQEQEVDEEPTAEEPIVEEKPKKLDIKDAIKKDSKETDKYKMLPNSNQQAIVVEAKEGIDQDTFLHYANEYSKINKNVVIKLEGVYLNVSEFPTVAAMLKKVEEVKLEKTKNEKAEEIEDSSAIMSVEEEAKQQSVMTPDNLQQEAPEVDINELIKGANAPQELNNEYDTLQNSEQAVEVNVEETLAEIDTMEEEDLNALKAFKEEAFRNPGDLEIVSKAIMDRQIELEKENDKTLDNSNDVRDKNNEDDDERDF